MQDVLEAIETELKGCVTIVGYRAKQQRLGGQITTIVFIAKETAHHIPKIIDPDDVEAHSKRRLKRRYIEAKVQTTFEVTLTKPMTLNRNLEI